MTPTPMNRDLLECRLLPPAQRAASAADRKSTRLNSSHLGISYAVFCLRLPPPHSTLFPYTTLFRSSSIRLPRLLKHSRSRSTRSTAGRAIQTATTRRPHQQHDANPHEPRSA